MFNPTKTLTILAAILLTLFATVLYASVDLNYFEAQWNNDDVTLRWETGTELDHAAFHVWRSTENLSINGSFQIDTSRAYRVTDQFILNPDQNPCTQQGYTYSYVDDTVNSDEYVYYYYLESFNCEDGGSEFQGNLDGIGGLEVRNPETPSVTPTRSATATPSVTPYLSSRLYLPLIMYFNPADYYSFEASQRFYLSNCNLTQVKGIIWDGESNSPLNDVTVRVWYDGAAFHEFYSPPSGSPPRKPGEWEITLAPYPKVGKWYVQVVDRQTGDGLSPKETVYTDNWCESGQGGRQIVIQDFVKLSEGAGIPISPSPTATPFDYPYPPPSTTVAWDTPTPERTETATPTVTPTQEPYVYARTGEVMITDGPMGVTTSVLSVVDDVRIRQIRAHLSIVHTNITDLDINLIHPNGISMVLHSEGEEDLPRWIEITGNDLAQIQGQSTQGDWVLEIIDRVATNTGTLYSWQIEIYP